MTPPVAGLTRPAADVAVAPSLPELDDGIRVVIRRSRAVRRLAAAHAESVAGVRDELTELGRSLAGQAATLRPRSRQVLSKVRAVAVPDERAWWPRPQPRPDAPAEPGARRDVPWRSALAAVLVAFLLWTLLDAPTLMHNAAGSPLGVRRTVAMVVLRPFAALSRDLGLSHVVGAADRVMGRTGGGVLQVVGPPARHRAAPVPRHVATPKPATDALPPLAAPTAAAPLRVLSIGDSLGVDFGGPFVNDLAATGVVNAVLDAHIDTGLSRPDYFDWPAELQADLARYQPQAVVVFLGANDPQNFVDGGSAVSFGSTAWADAYARRVGQVMAEVTGTGARLLWVGMPPMADPALTAKMQALDAIYQAQAAVHPGVTYLASWPVFSDAQGNFAQYLPDTTGAEVAVREPDGTHVSPAGAERLAQAVIAAMDHAWGLSLRP